MQHCLGLGLGRKGSLLISSCRSSSPGLPEGLQGVPTGRIGCAPRSKLPTGHREFSKGYPRGALNPAPHLLSKALVMAITHCAHLATCLETGIYLKSAAKKSYSVLGSTSTLLQKSSPRLTLLCVLIPSAVKARWHRAHLSGARVL